MTSAPDWIAALSTAATTILAGLAAWIGLRTFHNQRTVADVQLALNIFNEINRYWDRISEDIGSYEYNIGQILVQFEIAAGLFNGKILTGEATKILGDHIVEVFTQIKASEGGKSLMDRCSSAPSTFAELQSFIKNHFPQALNAFEFRNREQN